ncbi:MAG: efflux RND transporter periplasmic adaptor subunit [Patescibacteria group bacterium]|nr:efflux RND transporter periplasmic adaptor subunit [Patescibacteria group bacterium]
MSSSIIEQSKQAQIWHKLLQKKSFVIPVAAILVFFGIYMAFFGTGNQETSQEKATEIYEVQRSDISKTIDTDGTVIAEDGISLSFQSNGESTLTVQDVYVKEGDMVKKGDKIAKINTAELEMDLQSASTSKQIAIANLAQKQAGATQTEINIAQKQVDQAQASLNKIIDQNKYDIRGAEIAVEQAKLSLDETSKSQVNTGKSNSISLTDAQKSLEQAVESAVIKMKSSLLEVNNAVNDTKNLLDDQGEWESVLGAMNRQSVIDAKNAMDIVQAHVKTFEDKYRSITAESPEGDINQGLSDAIEIMKQASVMLDNLDDVIAGTFSYAYLSQDTIDAKRNSFNAENVKIKSSQESLINARQSIESAKLQIETTQTSGTSSTDSSQSKLSLAQKQLENAELQLSNTKQKTASEERSATLSMEIAKMQLAKLSEPLRDLDLATLRAQIDQAQTNINKIKYQIAQATMISPIDGKITALNGKAGDILVTENLTSFVTILNQDSFYISSAIEEMDIANIQVGQKVKATFDALPDLELEGDVTFISMTSVKDSSGIVTYEVHSAFSNLQSSGVREGMTASVQFVIKEAKDVLAIPSKAVKEQDSKKVVQMVDQSWHEVEVGADDGKNTEVISGLKQGDKIIVNSTLPKDTAKPAAPSSSGASADDKTAIMEKFGLSEADIEALKNMTDEERKTFMEAKGIKLEQMRGGGGTRAR